MSFTTTATQIGDLVAPTKALAANVGTSKATLAEVAALADEVTRRAQRERDRANLDLWLLRLPVGLVGAAITGASDLGVSSG